VNPDLKSEPNQQQPVRSVLNGRLFKTQILMLRGLRTRLTKLSQSRSVDRASLDANRYAAITQYQQDKSKTEAEHALGWRTAVTDWDSTIDKQLGAAERETLQSINEERQRSKRLKSEFIENKAAQKKWHADASDALLKRFEEAKLAAAKSRDNIKSKLESERSALEQFMHESREWVGLRTSSLTLQNLAPSQTAENTAEVASIHELSAIGKRFEETKKKMAVDMQRLKAHPVSRLSGSYWFVGICPLLGVAAGAIAWALSFAPLIFVVVGVVTAILFAVILNFVTAPLVKSTVTRLFPPVVEQEQLGYMLLLQGRRIAEATCQAELNRQEQQYKSGQEKLNEEHREKREKLLREFDIHSKQLVSTCQEKRKSIASRRSSRYLMTNLERKPLIDTLEKQHAAELADFERNHDATMERIEGAFLRSQRYAVQRWQQGCNETADRMKLVQQQTSILFPPWDSDVYTQGNWPRVSDSLAWKLGEIPPYDSLRRDLQSLGLPEEPPSQSWPVFYDLLSHGALVLETHADCKETSNKIVRNTLLRAVTSVPAGSLNITIIDPEG
jgi:hypothetical protein